jgi:hypothetical protein
MRRPREIAPCYRNSPSHGEARQKEIGVIQAFGDLGSEWMPDVPVTGDQSDSRRNCKIIEHLNAALVARAGIPQRKRDMSIFRSLLILL